MSMKKYGKPPVVERVISHRFTMDEENFRYHLNSWNDVINKAFPQTHIQNLWEISIATKDGFPYIPKESQKFTTKYQFWKGKKENRDCGIQVWPDRIAFNLLSMPEDPRTYEELYSLHKKWLPIWADHFQIKALSGATMEYVNILSHTTVPKFCNQEHINIGQILTAFTAPGPIKTLVPPFRFEMNFENNQKDFPLYFHAELSSSPQKQIFLRLLFRASTEAVGREITLDALDQEIHTAHRLILDEFEAFFTEEAKQSFSPYDNDTT